MKKEHRVYKYNNHIKRIIALCIIPWFVPLVCILTMESGENFNWGVIIFPLVFSAILILILHISRKLFLGMLISIDLDWHTMYMLDKRGENKKIYNLQLLTNVYLNDGEFCKMLDCADELLRLSSKPQDIYIATHQKILALFFSNNTAQIPKLIEQQRKTIRDFKISSNDDNVYYTFIENYLRGQYDNAIQIIKPLLATKNIEVFNNKRVFVNYLMLLAYSKINDSNQMQTCVSEILSADKYYRTFFSKKIIGNYVNNM